MRAFDLIESITHLRAYLVGLQEGYIRRAIFDEGISLHGLNVEERGDVWILRDGVRPIARVALVRSGLRMSTEHRWLG